MSIFRFTHTSSVTSFILYVEIVLHEMCLPISAQHLRLFVHLNKVVFLKSAQCTTYVQDSFDDCLVLIGLCDRKKHTKAAPIVKRMEFLYFIVVRVYLMS